MPTVPLKALMNRVEHASRREKLRIVSYYAVLFFTLIVFLFLWGSLPDDLFFWGQYAIVLATVISLQRVTNSWVRWILLSALTGVAFFLWWQRFGFRLLE